MGDIQLNFINQSDRNNNSIVVFQKNETFDFEDIAVAWKVIRNCVSGDRHPFTFPIDFT
jgi:hypothetical protein